MRNFFKRPSPCVHSTQINWIISVGIALFIFVFISIFRPFDIFEDLTISPLAAAACFAGITFVLNLIFSFGWHLHFVRKWDNRWTMGLELSSLFAHITSIGVVNHFFILQIVTPDYYDGISPLWIFFENMFYTYSIGFFPLVFVLIFFEMRLRAQYNSQSDLLQTVHANVQDIAVQVLIDGDSTENQIELSSETFLFARSSGNYVEYYSSSGGNIKKDLQRITLAKLEATLSTSNFKSIKTHRSYIVNVAAIKKISGNAQGYSLEIDGTDEKVPVSRHNISEFNRVMNG